MKRSFCSLALPIALPFILSAAAMAATDATCTDLDFCPARLGGIFGDTKVVICDSNFDNAAQEVKGYTGTRFYRPSVIACGQAYLLPIAPGKKTNLQSLEYYEKKLKDGWHPQEGVDGAVKSEFACAFGPFEPQDTTCVKSGDP